MVSSSATVLLSLAGLSLALWLYLWLGRSGFWRCDQRLPDAGPAPQKWPNAAVIVPARDEAEVVAAALESLLTQDYPGALQVFLVDDHSSDGTAQRARKTAQNLAFSPPLHIVRAPDLPPGWSGKLWALAEGVRQAIARDPDTVYFWFSDADIVHHPATLRRLVAKAETERRDLVSLMVALSAEGFWARLLVPPFVYFFQKLYPFPAINNPAQRAAGAAGGCILLRRAALEQAGGLAAVKGALIDDCALARLIKHRPSAGSGGIWLGLTTQSRSLRPYRDLGDIWNMVARTAYTQLSYSPLLLAGTLFGMTVTYLVPPAVFATGLFLSLTGIPAAAPATALATALATAAWAIMARTFLPALRLYGQPAWHAILLPLAAALYGAMTIDSALRHRRGKSGLWKGRVQGALEQDGARR